MNAGQQTIQRVRHLGADARCVVVATPLGQAIAFMRVRGWTVLGVGLGCWLLGWYYEWIALIYLAIGAFALLVASALLMARHSRMQVIVQLEPQRVTAGTPAAGQVRVSGPTDVLQCKAIELAVGLSIVRFAMPILKANMTHDELFVVPTRRRGVIRVGPATTVGGDPLGLLRRTITSTDIIELLVHPVTVPLGQLGTGLLPDLEGETTIDTAASELAYNALRDYRMGDDHRYIHWQSSAKASKVLVRQLPDAFPSNFVLIVDSGTESYSAKDDYETAISVAASIGSRAMRDDQDFTVIIGARAVRSAPGQIVLDTFARAQLGDYDLSGLTRRAARSVPDASVVFIISGSRMPFAKLRRASMHFLPEVRIIAMRIDPASPTSMSRDYAHTRLTLQSLSELSALLNGSIGVASRTAPPASTPPRASMPPPSATAKTARRNLHAAGTPLGEGSRVVDSASLGEKPNARSNLPKVLASYCPNRHITPAHSLFCRICQAPMQNEGTFEVARPTLGILRLSTGDSVMLDRNVLLGRAPESSASGDDRPHLVRLGSPTTNISRSHAEVVLDGWLVFVRDLTSTNGTVVTLPGQGPVRIRANDMQLLEDRTIVTLANEVSFTFEENA